MTCSKKQRFRRQKKARQYKHRTAPGKSMEEYEDRNAILLQLGFKDYKAYCRSQLWKSIRERKLAIDPCCYVCERSDGCKIQIHHGRYHESNLSGKDLSDLWTLCAAHHHWIEITKGGYKRNPEDATKEMFRIRRLAMDMKEKLY